MEDDYHEIFRLAVNYFFERYRKNGGTQRRLARQLGVTQPYISSVFTGKRTASIDLQSQVAGLLYGPYDEFLTIGRRIKNGLEPEMFQPAKADDSVELLIARLSHYVVDHKRIEDELVHMRGFFEDIVENMQSGVLVTNADDDITYMNRYMENIIGVPSDTIVGTNLLVKDDRFPERDLGQVQVQYNRAKENMKPVFYEGLFAVTSGGNRLWVTGWMVPMKDKNEYDGMIITAQDMTWQQKLIQALKASLEFSDKAFAVALQEKEGGPVISYFMNKKAMELFGLDKIDVEHDNIEKSMRIAARNIKNSAEWLEFTRKNFMGREKAEFEIHMLDGKRFIWESNALRGPNKEYYGRMVLLRNV